METADSPPGPARLAAYVRRHAPLAGYQLDVRGEQARLASDADMDPGVLSHLLKGARIPFAKNLWPLARALAKRTNEPPNNDDARRHYTEMLVEGGIIPAESVAQGRPSAVSSHPITAEVLADQWGVKDAKSRELVHDMLNRLRMLAQQPPDDQSNHGSAEAHG